MKAGPSVSSIVLIDGASPDALGIGSVLAQASVEVELLLVGSRAGHRAFERLPREDGRVRFIEMPKDSRPAAMKNAGFEQAQGDWITILEADDELAPERTGRLLAFADATGADIVADNVLAASGGRGGASQYPAFTQGPRPYGFVMSAKRLVEDHGRLGRVSGSRLLRPMFKRSFVVGNGLRHDERLPAEESLHFCLGALAKGAKYLVTSETYCVARSSAGLSPERLRPNHLPLILAAVEEQLASPTVEGDAAEALRLYKRLLGRSVAYARFRDLAESGQAIRALLLAAARPDLWRAIVASGNGSSPISHA